LTLSFFNTIYLSSVILFRNNLGDDI